MIKLKNYISTQLDDILSEGNKLNKNPLIVANKLKSLGISSKSVKKAIDRMKKVVPDEIEDDIFPDRINSDETIKNIITIRKMLKGKSPIFVENNLKNEKEAFINHYDNLFNNGASELPGILELYSLFRTKRDRPNIGKGYLFKMLPEDAKSYGKDIVKYFLVKNIDVFPVNARAKISFDAYMDLLILSKVDKTYIDKTRKFYYDKYKL